MRLDVLVCLGLSLALTGVAFGGEPASMGPPLTIPTDTDGVQRTTVILDSYSYQPSHLIVEKGKPVELTLKSVTMLTPPPAPLMSNVPPSATPLEAAMLPVPVSASVPPLIVVAPV